jgi:hypothetical protein
VHFDSVYKSWCEIAGEGVLAFNALDLRMGAAMRLNGNNSAEGFTLMVGLRYNFGAWDSSDDEIDPDADLRFKKKKRRSDFAPQKDSYDESLFSDDPTRPPRDSSVEDESDARPRRRKSLEREEGTVSEEKAPSPSNPLPQPEVKLLKAPPKPKPKPKKRVNKRVNKLLNDAEKELEGL